MDPRASEKTLAPSLFLFSMTYFLSCTKKNRHTDFLLHKLVSLTIAQLGSQHLFTCKATQELAVWVSVVCKASHFGLFYLKERKKKKRRSSHLIELSFHELSRSACHHAERILPHTRGPGPMGTTGNSVSGAKRKVRRSLLYCACAITALLAPRQRKSLFSRVQDVSLQWAYTCWQTQWLFLKTTFAFAVHFVSP